MINNYKVYTNGLSLGLQDKIFFLNKINATEYDTIVDFGSGTGNVLKAIRPAFSPYADLIGIESDASLIVSARFACEAADNIRFYPNVDVIKNRLTRDKNKKTLLILSSVLHELCDQESISTVNFLINCADTVVLRDMKAPSNVLDSDMDDMDDISVEVFDNIVNNTPNYMIDDFYNQHGSIFKNKRNLYHFLLKYSYVENWSHEVKEDYFHGEDLIKNNTINLRDFGIIYSENFHLPHQAIAIKEKFGYSLNDTTHMKRIYIRNGSVKPFRKEII